MIATILPGSTNFHAVGYNEHKVSKGVARAYRDSEFRFTRDISQTNPK